MILILTKDLYKDFSLQQLILFTQPLRSDRIWHKVSF